MKENHRPDPEKLLKQVQKEELQEKQGKLKIYLGAAPGVGKTYSMLQDALIKRGQGFDVVIGVAESHGRQEIENLVKIFEILPKQVINYKGIKLHEFDLDGALNRNPGLILMDEMAHTNASGLRHDKRWQDIKEILNHGIDVYTTCNVQHIESINDIAAKIIEVKIKETVPDSILELADTIELVDLPPEDLLKRLREGKVYFPNNARLAAEKFFQKGNLAALRELALRFTAERVRTEVLLYRKGKGKTHLWQTKEKILVCVGPGIESNRLIRTACRMSTNLHADWIAVHIDSPRLHFSEEQQNDVTRNLRFAEQLGAETKILSGFDLVKEIIAFAREQNVTLIMVWKHIHSHWRNIFFKSLADEIVRYSSEINVFIVTPSITDEYTDVVPEHLTYTNKTSKIPAYAVSIGVVALVTYINFFLGAYFANANLIMTYLLGVTVVALLGRTGPSILACILSVLACDFFFIPPRFSFAISDIQYFFTLMVMLIVTLVISHLTVLTRRQAEAARISERHMATLHTLSQKLSSTRSLPKLLELAVHHMGDIFNSGVAILLPEKKQLVTKAHYRTDHTLNPKEQSVAQWSFDSGQIAGRGTDTLPFSKALYVPLLAPKGIVGVLRVQPMKPNYLFTPIQMRLLESCANQIAIVIEVDRL